MLSLVGQSLAELYPLLLDRIMADGRVSGPRGKTTRTIDTTILVINDPVSVVMTSPLRRWNYRFAVAEAGWIASGSDDAEWIGRFNKAMLSFSDDGKTLAGAYGPRVVLQLPWVFESLQRDMDTRQAVITTWYPRAAGEFSKDVPCTVAMHFQVIESKLCLTVFMRSNDAWLGLPYDAFSFTVLQRIVAQAIGLPPGPYTHIASNMHLYASDMEAAHALTRSFIGGMEGPPMNAIGHNVGEHLLDAMDGVSYTSEDGFVRELAAVARGDTGPWLQRALAANGRS